MGQQGSHVPSLPLSHLLMPKRSDKAVNWQKMVLIVALPVWGAHCSVSIAAAAHPAGLGAGRAPWDGMLLLPPSSSKTAAEWALR